MDTTSSTHPLAPPTREETLVAWLRLIRSRRVGVATFFRLLAEHGSAEAALDALPAIARAAGAKDYHPCDEAKARRELERGRAAGARIVAIGAPDYPAALASIPDPPPLLWTRGRTELAGDRLVAVVGARNASSLGTRMARSMAKGLGEAGFTVASGLARGVDAAAHMAALDSGTVAVVAGGIDVIYPAENAGLAERIASEGLMISEQPVGLTPQARHFPQRNRLISGISAAVVVVEAAARSGSLTTARTALDQGRDVLAVPGHPFDARAAGCNMLIRDGATLVRGPADVAEALAPAAAPAGKSPRNVIPEIPQGPPRRSIAAAEIPALHAEILNRLGPSPVAEDQLIRDLGRPARQVSPELLTLELEGHIARQAGGLLSRKN